MGVAGVVRAREVSRRFDLSPGQARILELLGEYTADLEPYVATISEHTLSRISRYDPLEVREILQSLQEAAFIRRPDGEIPGGTYRLVFLDPSWWGNS